MTTDEDKNSGINWLALSLLSLLIAAAAGAAYLYLPALMPQRTTDIVMIRAEEGPFKTKPADPGGKIITNQGSQVMKMLDDLTLKTEEVETLLPPSGTPELPPVTVEAEPKPEAVVADENGSKKNDTVDTKTDNKTTVKPSLDNDKATQVEKSGIQASGTVSRDAVPAELSTKKPAKNIVAAPKPTKPVSKPITTSRVTTNPNDPTYMIQLAAFRKEDVAAEQAGLLLKKHEKRLQGATLGTIRVDSGENVTFWRVVSEPLPREAADTICASLKRAGQDCILRKFTSPSQ